MSRAQASAAGHRLRRARQQGQAMPSLVSVVSLVAVLAAVVVFFAGGGDDGDAPAARPQARTETADAATPSPSPSPAAPPADRADRPAAGPPGEDRAPRQPGRRPQEEAGKDRSTPRPEPTRGPPEVYIEVYNNTSISGLAATKAAELQDAGWQVVGVDNWYGDIPASTVYYPDGLREEARRLRAALGIGRIHVAVAPMKFDRLTVILRPDAS
jgi:LytR cell envelope-related transcriptional attenuator